MGTVAYMSPEQTQGEEIDHRTDIWSLGVVLYEMLTGKLPFRGEHEQAIVYSILKEKPEPITSLKPDIPASIEQVVSKALEKDPSKRYQQVEELLDDLKSLSAGIVPEEIKARLRKAKISRNKRTIMTGSAILVILIILGLFIIPRIFHSGEEPEKSIAVVPFHYLSDEPEKQYLADLYQYVGNKEWALDCLEQAYEMRDPNMPYLMTSPDYDSLRDEPRFQELLRKMNLPGVHP